MIVQLCEQLINLKAREDKLLYLWKHRESEGLYLNILIVQEQIQYTEQELKKVLDKDRLPPIANRDK